jgi:two-component system CheB/CheR fusion protein
VIVHLAPDRKSELPSIIGRWTSMPVVQVADHDQVPLDPNHVYVIAPDRTLEIADSTVGASPFEQARGERSAVDLFFRSLAARHGDAFAIILSGSGSDGALGAKAVKASGGVVLVQDPDEAAFRDMPRNVIATGIADVVLPVHLLAARLAELVRNKQRIAPIVVAAEARETMSENEERALKNVLDFVRKKSGHDFSRYKRTTIVRRLSRRLQLTQQPTIEDYWQFLRANADEADALFEDLIVSVTLFFRDPKTWSALQTQVIPALIDGAATDQHIRVWVPGCATGEEAYTLAILFHEEFERRHMPRKLVIFASDIDEGALSVAREGLYSQAIAADVSEARLERYFRADDDHYRVGSELREHVVFAAHNLLRDPPFSRVHLISCRNLLIYLERDLQDQIVSIFRYACRDDGYLVLGESESAPGDQFQTVDKKHRIFRARARASGDRPTLPTILATPDDRLARTPREVHVPARSPIDTHLAALEAAAPPSVVVDDHWNVVHLSSFASQFLQQSGGPLARRITELVRPELRDELHYLLHRAIEQQAPQLSEFAVVPLNGVPHRVGLLAQPRPRSDGAADILVTFLDAGAPPSEPVQSEPDEAARRVGHVREQLRQAERRIETMRYERNETNEDLRAANEELQSLNEEYRSTTEELETSKEELQSVNEELHTVNQELKLKLDEVSRTHGDLENLIAAANVAIVFLDRDLTIRRFTPQLNQVFNVKTRDLDRPLSDLTHVLQYETLEDDARRVLATGQGMERTLATGDGRVLVVRFGRYATGDGQAVEGVVITFIDVTPLKEAEAALRASERRLEEELQVMRRLHQLTLSAAIAPGIPEAMLDIVTAAVELQAAQFGTAELIGPRTNDVGMVAHLGLTADERSTIQEIERRKGSASDRALQHRKTIQIPDILEGEASHDLGSDVLRLPYRGVQRTPLITRNGKLVGLLSIYFAAPHDFTERDAQLSAMIGQQGADLIESRQQHDALQRSDDDLRTRTGELASSRAQVLRQAEALVGYAEDHARADALQAANEALDHRVRERTLHVQALLQRLVSVQEEERGRMARDIHDQLGQQMTALRLHLDALQSSNQDATLRQQAERTARLAEDLDRSIDFLTWELRPAALDHLGLAAALNQLVTEWSERFGIAAEFNASGGDQPRLRFDAEAHLYRLVQEALHNVVKHAQATHVSVRLERGDGESRLVIEDDGRGFDFASARERQGRDGFGLSSMRERATLAGGQFAIESSPSTGTSIVIRISTAANP